MTCWCRSVLNTPFYVGQGGGTGVARQPAARSARGPCLWRRAPLKVYRGTLWVSSLKGHLRTHGYEDTDGDSLRPPKSIHFRELTGSSGLFHREMTGNSGPFKACSSIE